MTISATDCDLEVVTFVATEGAYYFILNDGRRADIVKCRPLQPTIVDHQHYPTYLWVKAYQGYFLLCQHFLDYQAQPWRAVREIEVSDEDFDFFEQYGDRLQRELEPARAEQAEG